VLQKFCFKCHGEKTAKSGLRLDTLSADFLTARTSTTWNEILRRIEDRGEDMMPPEGKPGPSGEEIQVLHGWIESKLAAVADADAAAQKTEGRAQLRRLNRVEVQQHAPRSARDRRRSETAAAGRRRRGRLR
jgi:hypothetical protein